MKQTQTLEQRANGIIIQQLCPYADKCVVEPASNEICTNDYTYCEIYQELIKYKEEFLRK